MCAYVCVSDYISIFNLVFLLLFTTLLCTPTIHANNSDNTTPTTSPMSINTASDTPTRWIAQFPPLLGMITFFALFTNYYYTLQALYARCIYAANCPHALNTTTNSGYANHHHPHCFNHHHHPLPLDYCHLDHQQRHHPLCPVHYCHPPRLDWHNQRNCHHLTMLTPMQTVVMPTATIPCILIIQCSRPHALAQCDPTLPTCRFLFSPFIN